MRYPLEPLVEAMREQETSAKELAPKLGVTARTITRWRSGGLTEDQADRAAARAGLPTLAVWPDWGAEALEKARQRDEARMVECADEKCSERFLPSRKGHRFCSKRCSKRHNARIRYQQVPGNREARLAASRRYDHSIDRAREKRRRYHDNVDENRAKARAYYEANRDRVRAQRRARYHEQKGQAA